VEEGGEVEVEVEVEVTWMRTRGSLVLFCFLLDVSDLSCYLLEIVLVILVLDLKIWRKFASVSVSLSGMHGTCTHLAAAARRPDFAPCL